MINYDKLNGMIVSRETLDCMKNDPDITEHYKSGETIQLDRWNFIHKNGNKYYVYTRGGVIHAYR